MEKLRVKNRAVNIEVNDDGEYITIDFNDMEFVNKFYNLIKSYQEQEPKLQKKITEIKKLSNDKNEYGLSEQQSKGFEFYYEFCESLKNQVDDLFGKDTCRKVFGDKLPSHSCFKEFFDAVEPYLIKYSKESTTVMNKYSAKRVGDNV